MAEKEQDLIDCFVLKDLSFPAFTILQKKGFLSKPMN